MKMQLKVIAAAAAFAVAGSASAAINYGNNQSGEMFFSVWDSTNQVSYTRDLGLDVLTYANNPTAINLGPDALLTSFIANHDATAGAAPLMWNVGGISAFTVNSLADLDKNGLVSTSSDPITNALSLTQGDFNAATIKGQSFAQGVNTLDGASNTDFSLNLSTQVNAGNGGYYGSVNWGNNWGGTIGAFNTDTTIGSTLNLMFVGQDSTKVDYTTGVVGMRVLDLGKLTLKTDGTLVSAVPAPAAVWLFSLGMLGLVGIARRRGKSA